MSNMTPAEVLAYLDTPCPKMQRAHDAVAALIAERDAAMDVCRKLAALRDGLDNSNSSAEEMASRLAHKAQALVALREGGSHG